MGRDVKITQTQSGGVGFFGLLTALFVGLKLINVISWSWWLVLLPAYGPIGIGFLALACFMLWVGAQMGD